MKQIILFLALISPIISKAQNESDCFQKYAKVFEVRGANEVEDGTYEDVVITIRKGSFTDCLMGKVTVSGGLVVRNSIALIFVDGTFEPFRRAYKGNDPITITNGMSKTLITEDDELIKILFISAIKPKKKAFKKAPDPSFDL